MNARCFKVIFSKRLGALVAVALELGCAGGAVAQTGTNTLPSGGTVSTGSASISTQGATMTVQQGSTRSSIHWNSFSIGSGASVNFVQPAKDAVMLNRVTGPDASQILGRMSANGQLLLINPNGIVFGTGSSVNANGFIASTLSLSDESFLSGNYRFSRGGSAAGVVNQGNIQADAGGYVMLLGAQVRNEGTIRAPQGSVVLAAGEALQINPAEALKVPVGTSGKIRLNLTPSSVNAAISNSASGLIQAQGGQVLLQAAALNDAMSADNTARAQVLQSGTIDTQAAQGAQGAGGGAVTLLADHGSIRVDGSIRTAAGADLVIGREVDTGTLAATTDVSGATLQSQGGLVETSGDWLKTDGVQVQAANWLLDPANITIAAANTNIQGSPNLVPTSGANVSTIDVATINGALNAGTSVTINTTNSGTAGTADGSITVASAISKSAGTDATLTLNANNGIALNAAVSASGAGTGKLHVNMTAAGVAATAANSFGIAMNSTINANGGTVTLSGTSNNAGTNGITFNNGSGVTAGSYTITGTANATTGGGNGVQMAAGATTSFTSGSGASVIRGSTASSAAKGVFIAGGNTVTNINSGAGSAVVESAATSAAGMRIGFGGGATVNTSGNVTIGSQNNNTSELLAQGAFNATAGSLTFKGRSATVSGIVFQDGGGVAASVTGSNGAVINADGISTAASAYGVDLSGPAVGASFVTSGAGNSINITGTGANIGVSTRIANSTFTANNAGSINITGSSTGGNAGVEVNGTLTANGAGSINITGSSASTTVAAVNITATGRLTANAGAINITSDSVTIASAAQLSTGAGTGTVTIANKAAGTAINLGGADVLTGGPKALGLTDAELDRITTGNLVIGATGAAASGTTTVSANINPALAQNLTVRSGADIVLAANSAITALPGGNVTLNADADGNASGAVYFNTGAGLNSNGGNIIIGGGAAGDGSGYAYGNSTFLDGIFMETSTLVSAAGGNITMRGKSATLATGTPGTTLQNGIRGRGNTITTTGAGNITLTGQGLGAGSLSQSMGLRFQASTITGGSSGTVGLTGTGSTSDAGGLADGIYLAAGSLGSSGGNIVLSGVANGTAAASATASYGVTISSAQTVSAGGTGSVTLQGTGGNSAATNNYGVYLSGANTRVSSNAGAINITAAANSGSASYALNLDTGAAIASGGNASVTLTADSVRLGSTESVSAGSGTLTVQNKTAGTLIDLGGTDVLTGATKTLALGNAELARFTAGTLVVGRNDASAAGNAVVSSAVMTGTSGDLSLKTGGGIAVNAALNVGSGSKDLTLSASNAVTQSAAITAAGLDLQGSASYTLNNSGNTVSTLATASGVGAVDFVNSGALTVGNVGSDSGISAIGPVSVATQTGVLTVAANISTGNAGSAAIVLNAGRALSANTSTSGSDLIVSGTPSITTGTGGRATLYSGTVAGSSGLTALVGAGSGRFRYKSDEVASNFSTALGSGLHAIYRESPALTIAVQNASRGYDTGTFSGGSANVSGNVNGDTATQIGSSLVWGGTAQGARDAGTYSIVASGSNALGYTEVYTNNPATLTIGKATLFVIANNDARFVTLADTAGYNGVSYTGWVGGETAAVLSGTAIVNRPNAATDVAAGTYTGALVPTGVTSNNYAIQFVNGTYDIVPAKGMIICTPNSSATYGNASAFADPVVQYLDGNGSSISTLTKAAQTGNTYTYNDNAGGSITFTLAPQGAASSSSGNAVVGSYLLSDAAPGVTGNNFNAPPVFVGQLSITGKGVNVVASGSGKTYDGTNSMNALQLDVPAKVNGDALSASGTGAYASKNAGNGLAYTVSNIALGGADAANYYLAGANALTGNDGTITAAALQLSTSNVSKTYDGSTTATGNLQIVGGSQLFAGDSLSGGTFLFDTKNVGNGNKTVSTSGVTVNDGNGGANYAVSYVDNTTSSVSARTLTVSGITAASKSYDGTIAAGTSSAGAVLSGLVQGDAVTVASSGSFADSNAGVAKTVLLSNSYAGADLGNYAITDQTGTVADINPKALSVSLQGTVTKVYDGSTAASLNAGNLVVSGFVGSDGGTVTQAAGQYASKNVSANGGNGRVDAVLSAADFTPDAATNFNNYALPGTATGLVGRITPKPIDSSYLAANKTYDGSTQASVQGASTGFVAGDAVRLSNRSAAFDTAAVGVAKTVTIDGIALEGADSSNYVLAAANATARADITPEAPTPSSNSLPIAVVNPVTFAGTSSPNVQLIGSGAMGPFGLSDAGSDSKQAIDESRKGLRCRPVAGVAGYSVCEPQASVNSNPTTR